MLLEAYHTRPVMERQSFTVLPPLSPRLAPPAATTTPSSSRIAPRSVAHRESSPFIVIAELGDNVSSGRASPFRGRGFKASPQPPANSKIPLPAGKSAPTTPVKKKVNISIGKSAPSSPVKRNQINGTALQRKRNESPSKLPIIKTSSPQAMRNKELQRRVTGKPPIPKHAAATAKSNGNRAPQPAKRGEQPARPTPTARPRLTSKTTNKNNTSNEFSNDNKNVSGVADVPIVAKRDKEKKSTSKVAEVKKTQVTPPVSKEPNKEGKANVEGDTLTSSEPKTDISKKNNVSVVISSHDNENVQTLNIEVNSPNGSKIILDKNDLMPPAKDLVEQSSLGKVSEQKDFSSTKTTPDKSNYQLKKDNEKLTTDGDAKSDITSLKKEIQGLFKKESTAKRILKAAGKVKNTVVDVHEEIVKDASDTIIKVEENLNNKVADKDATLVEWTTKQPLELVQPPPDVIPTDLTASSIEEKPETVQGPPEVEVEAGNHTVTFR